MKLKLRTINTPVFNSSPTSTRDGFYRVYVVEYEGDIRGQPWYMTLTCLSVDPFVENKFPGKDD